ncbi:hypothetical protein [Butyrivibrio proteoclasticus]|uniref:hypothetical protein n=1 Tax=Butyrivibrio proteoclasticus TaxID=43305 RepID=UPI00047BBDAD|nr:hypothetical protein [Butyrivibrio proteoclasticus]
MSSYTSGIIAGAGLILTIFIVSLIVRLKLKKGNDHYDERQVLVRGNGYKISFMTVLLLNIIYAGFFYGPTRDIVAPQLVLLAIPFIGVAEYTIYCIFNDAYVGVGQKTGKWIILILFVIVSNTLCAIYTNEPGLSDNGFATGGSINAMIALVFGVILIAFLIKHFIDKRGDANEES